MILPNMNKIEILKESRDVFSLQDKSVRGSISQRIINLSRISFRRKHLPVYAGIKKMDYKGTTYFAVSHLTFPYGTKSDSNFHALIQTFALSRSPQGKPLLLYIVPVGESETEYYENSPVSTYSHHFLSRFWERTRGFSPKDKSFEDLARYFMEKSGLNRVQRILEGVSYKDFPPPLCISRTDIGLELGSYNTDQEIYYFNTFVPEEMFHNQQKEEYGEGSWVYEFLKQSNIELTELSNTLGIDLEDLPEIYMSEIKPQGD